MFVSKIKLEGFKGFSTPKTYLFDNTTVISGRNGSGKTSLTDAMSWGLFGPDSYPGPKTSVISYGTNHCQVQVTCELDDGKKMIVTRELYSHDHKTSQKLKVTIDGVKTSGIKAGETAIKNALFGVTEKVWDSSSKLYSSPKMVLNSFLYGDDDSKLQVLQDACDPFGEYEKTYRVVNKALKDQRDKLKNLEGKVHAISETLEIITPVDPPEEDVEEREKELSSLKKSYSIEGYSRSELEAELQSIRDEKNALFIKLDNLEDKYHKKEDELSQCEDDIELIHKKNRTVKSRLDVARISRDFYSDRLRGTDDAGKGEFYRELVQETDRLGACVLCGSNNVDQVHYKLDHYINELSEAEEDYQHYQHYKNLCLRLENQLDQEKEKSLKSQFDFLDQTLVSLEDSFDKVHGDVDKLSKEEKRIEKLADHTEDNDDKEYINQLEKKVSHLHQQQALYDKYLHDKSQVEDQLDKAKTDLNSQVRVVVHFQELRREVSPRGDLRTTMEELTDRICEKVDQYYKKYVKMDAHPTIEFVPDSTMTRVFINAFGRDISTLSHGESAVLAMVFVTAFNNAIVENLGSNLPLVLDEPEISVDPSKWRGLAQMMANESEAQKFIITRGSFIGDLMDAGVDDICDIQL